MSAGKILIVEDDLDIRTVYSLILERAGHEIHTAVNGELGLSMLDKSKPNLVLLDIFMPVMDGQTFMEKLDRTKYPGLKIIVCSNTSDQKLLDRMAKLGADKVITKAALGPSDLVSLVAEYI
jgi:CheY-like chemotaxis protein